MDHIYDGIDERLRRFDSLSSQAGGTDQHFRERARGQ